MLPIGTILVLPAFCTYMSLLMTNEYEDRTISFGHLSLLRNNAAPVPYEESFSDRNSAKFKEIEGNINKWCYDSYEDKVLYKPFIVKCEMAELRKSEKNQGYTDVLLKIFIDENKLRLREINKNCLWIGTFMELYLRKRSDGYNLHKNGLIQFVKQKSEDDVWDVQRKAPLYLGEGRVSYESAMNDSNLVTEQISTECSKLLKKNTILKDAAGECSVKDILQYGRSGVRVIQSFEFDLSKCNTNKEYGLKKDIWKEIGTAVVNVEKHIPGYHMSIDCEIVETPGPPTKKKP